MQLLKDKPDFLGVLCKLHLLFFMKNAFSCRIWQNCISFPQVFCSGLNFCILLTPHDHTEDFFCLHSSCIIVLLSIANNLCVSPPSPPPPHLAHWSSPPSETTSQTSPKLWPPGLAGAPSFSYSITKASRGSTCHEQPLISAVLAGEESHSWAYPHGRDCDSCTRMEGWESWRRGRRRGCVDPGRGGQQ